MKIIIAPHQTLRTKAISVEKLDKKIIKFVQELEKTLKQKESPKGVGLAAPQVDKKWRIFVTQLPLDGQDFTRDSDQEKEQPLQIRHFINPIITKHSQKLIFGETEGNKEPRLEGCLSIPKIYAPVPRWTWVELKYEIIKGGKLIKKTEKFTDFMARVIQHETDHLDGILFTDYALEHDSPIYFENEKTGKLEETTNRGILENL